MAALTTQRKITRYGEAPFVHKYSYPVLAAAKIYAGALVVRKYGQQYVQQASVALGMGFGEVIGVATCDADNTSGASGDVTVEAETGTFKFINGDTITAAHVGCSLYASDDQTAIKGSTGNQPFLGRLVDVVSDGVIVTLGPDVQGNIITAKALIGHADFTDADTEQALTLGVLPPNCRLIGRELNGTVFSGGGVGSAVLDVGGTDTDGIVINANVFTGAAMPALGAAGAEGAAGMSADFGGQTITCTLTVDTTVAALTAGAIEITLIFAKGG